MSINIVQFVLLPRQQEHAAESEPPSSLSRYPIFKHARMSLAGTSLTGRFHTHIILIRQLGGNVLPLKVCYLALADKPPTTILLTFQYPAQRRPPRIPVVTFHHLHRYLASLIDFDRVAYICDLGVRICGHALLRYTKSGHQKSYEARQSGFR